MIKAQRFARTQLRGIALGSERIAGGTSVQALRAQVQGSVGHSNKERSAPCWGRCRVKVCLVPST